MKSFDILEALTDMDDDILLRAAEDPPKRYYVWLRVFRSAAAACLIFALVFTALIATDAIAFEPGLRWRVRYRENEVTWLFKDGIEQDGEFPSYEPAWLPEGYELCADTWGPTLQRSMSYKYPDDDQGWIWFHYMQITDKDTYHLDSLANGTYEVESIEINGSPGELYTYLDDADSGQLIWIDRHNCIVFLLGFDSGTEDAIRIAESVKLTEEKET